MEKAGWNWLDMAGAAFLLGAALWLRRLLAGWLLPDGELLEKLAQCISGGGESVAQTVFSEVQQWLLQ